MWRPAVIVALVAWPLLAMEQAPPAPAALRVVTPVAAPHAYFDALVARPDHWRSYSLRDPAQLAAPKDGGYAHSNTMPLRVTYDPFNDPDPRRQDAAKVVIPTDSNSLRNQVRLPIATGGDGFMLTWDVWMGAEFMTATSGLTSYKLFQLDSGGGAIWTEIRALFGLAKWYPGVVQMTDIRVYGTAGETRGSKVLNPDTGTVINYGSDSLGGQIANYFVKPETWTRYWVWIRPRPNDAVWCDLSMWMADEQTDAVQLFDKTGVRPNGPDRSTGWGKFWLEYNTSTSTIKAGRPDLISYARNVVLLKNPPEGDVPTLLERPLAGPVGG